MRTFLGRDEALIGNMKSDNSCFHSFTFLCWSERRQKVSLYLSIYTYLEASKGFNLNYCLEKQV